MPKDRHVPLYKEPFVRAVWAAVRPQNLGASLFAVVVLMLASKVLLVATPLVLRHILDALPGVPPSEAILSIGTLVVIYCICRFASELCQEGKNAIFAPVSARASSEALRLLHDNVLKRTLSFLAGQRAGAIVRIIERAAESSMILLNQLVFHVTPKLLEVTLSAALLGWFYGFWPVAILLATLGLYVFATVLLTNKRKSIKRETDEIRHELSATLTENIHNFEILKILGSFQGPNAVLPKVASRFASLQTHWEMNLVLINTVQALIVSAGLCGMMAFAWFRVQASAFSVGDFALVNSLFIQVSVQLTNVASMYRNVSDSASDIGAGCRLFVPETQEEPLDSFTPSSNEICVANVSVKYGAKEALTNISLTVPENSRLAIVGETGGGKSTLAKVLIGLTEPTSGEVSIGGRVLGGTHTLADHMVSVVPQDVTLFNASIEDNIRVACPQASAEEVLEAAGRAGLNPVLERLEDGIKSGVGERGLRLSGGERQRVALARALLRKPKILVLDEATSALDNHTEREVQRCLDSLEGASMIVVAHRMHTIRNFAKIAVLERGHLVAVGDHLSLFRDCEIYRRMWSAEETQRLEPKH